VNEPKPRSTPPPRATIALRGALFLLASAPMVLLYAAAVGLGLHRHGQPWAVSLAATTAVFLPPLLAAVAATRERFATFCGAGLAWSLAGLLALPVYFPGERRDAVTTGLALLAGGQDWSDLARSVAESLPDEPDVAAPELAAAVEVADPILPPAEPIGDHEIVLPYEGEGRNLAIPVVFEHDGREVEVMMMLDTGATYTTLSDDVLAQLGLTPSERDPVIRLHTANGEREANILAVDAVWLGDLRLDGVALATCNQCSSRETAGLLGLNVASGFNVAIDADRHEVTFSRRANHDRKLDIKPWLDLDARFARYPGGRVEVEIDALNTGDTPIRTAAAVVRCGERRWSVDLGALPPDEPVAVRRKLPSHPACEAYEIALDQARY
jgi:clan AA aspartic protease (TIGR02281 family)